MLLFLYPPEPQGSFLCGLRCQPNGNLIGKSVEKSGNVWYNELIRADNLPYKSEFNVVGENMNADFRINGKVIETERLILRPFRQTDLEDFYEYASVEGVGEMAGWKHHESIAESQSVMNSFISNDKVFAICLKENNKVIGTVGIEKYGLEDALTEFKDYYGRELGYVLSKDYWGNGLVPEAVNAVIDYLFNELDYDFLLCGYYNFNERSKRVQEKCGFKPYRSLAMTTQMGTKEQGTLMLLMNPKKNIKLVFSHRETLIFE